MSRGALCKDHLCYRPMGFVFGKPALRHVRSKDIDLWGVIQNGYFVFIMMDPETKLEMDKPFLKLKIDEKRKFGNSQVKDYEIDLPIQQYEKFSISSEETIDSGYTRFDVIVTSLKPLDKDYSNMNHVRKFICALPLKWRLKVTTIEKAKDLAKLPINELIGNCKIYEMVLRTDEVVSKNSEVKVKSLDLKAKVTRDQTSDDSDNQDGSEGNEEDDEEFKSMVKNLRKYFKKGRAKVLEVLDKNVVVMVAVARTTSLMIIRRRGRKRLSLVELGVIVKTVIN
ncbi:hypothetical protein Tco_1071139 [Tanacetum coccineum]|uniref:UBN2 domain-containing protein n=1 Tax=Tanacetum coccineum TaxID=301880 RepID=A0ABQ5HQ03_9ASTR